MRYYPIFLDLSTHSCLVIGGGMVAERKVESLLQARGQVTVVSPTLTPKLRSWVADQVITAHERPYRSGDLKGFALVFAATDDEELQRQIAAEEAWPSFAIPLRPSKRLQRMGLAGKRF